MNRYPIKISIFAVTALISAMLTHLLLATNCPPPPTVEISVSKTTLTLLEEISLTLTGIDQYPVECLDGIKFEIKRDGGADWHSLQNGSGKKFEDKVRVAGKFKVRATLDIDGTEVKTSEKPMEVQFPDVAKILAGDGVMARMEQAWNDTKNATTSTSRREEGYYINLDTKTEAYGITAHTVATPVGNADGASWDTVTTPRPPDVPETPLPTEKPTYTVAWYHTHTATTHRTFGRPVGESNADKAFGAHNSINIPGYAHDYVESPAGTGAIPGGHPLNSPAKIYNITTPDRRSTP